MRKQTNVETKRGIIMRKFIKFNDFYTSNSIMCDPEDISSFYKTEARIPNVSFPRSCTKIIMKNGVAYTVDEQMETVEKMIINNKN